MSADSGDWAVLRPAEITPDPAEALRDLSWLDEDDTPKPAPLIVSAMEAAIDQTLGDWLLRPYLEGDVLALLYGDYGTLKSFIAIDWSLRIALGIPALGYQFKREPRPVVYISAEGKGLWKRLRGWAIRNFPGDHWVEVLQRSKLYCIRRPMNLSAAEEVLHLAASIEALGIRPALVVVDTLSRNSNGEPERSTDAAVAYLNHLDRGLRSYFGASVLLVHHVGHADKERARGPIVFAANTDAEIRVTRPDRDKLEVTVELIRLKDSDLPAVAGLRGVVIELGEQDRDGQDITTLAIESMSAPPTIRRPVAGKNQTTLLAAIARHADDSGRDLIDSPTLRRLAEDAGIDRRRYMEAITGLDRLGYVRPSVGGYLYVRQV